MNLLIKLYPIRSAASYFSVPAVNIPGFLIDKIVKYFKFVLLSIKNIYTLTDEIKEIIVPHNS